MTRAVTPKPATPSTDDIEAARAAAVVVAESLDLMSEWLDDVARPQWDEFIDQARKDVGMDRSDLYDRSNPRVHGYDIALTADGARFSGTAYYLGDPEEEEFVIPWTFLDPATRPHARTQIRAALAAERTEKRERDAENARLQADRQRQQALSDLETNAARLGMKVIAA